MSCTSLHRSWSWKAAVDVNIFLRPHLRNWCWKPFSGMLTLSLLLLLILIIGFTCPASIRFKFMTKCDDYNNESATEHAWCGYMNSYYFSFPSGFLFGRKGREEECLKTIHYPCHGGLGAAPPNGVILNLSLYFKSFVRWETGRGEKLLFFIWTTNVSVFFHFCCCCCCCFPANVYFVCSSVASRA